MIKRLFGLLLTLGLFASGALAQGLAVAPQQALRNVGTYMAAMVGATVTVCAANTAGLPCNTPLTNTIFKDTALSQPLTNPFFADNNGNYTFVVNAAATYTVTVTQFGQGYSYQLTVGSTSSGAICTTNPNTLQYNNAGLAGCAAGLTTPDGNQLRIKGPGPFADVTAFGVRAVPVAPQSTCSISATSTSMSLPGGASTFQNGDGIDCLGAGATLTLSTPASLTVTHSLAIVGTGLGGGNVNVATVASGTGSSTYLYEAIYRDIGGGYTAPSTATTITNGLAALGPQTCAISTMSLSNNVLTVNFSSVCAGAIQTARMQIQGSPISLYNGWYNISTVNSSTQVLINNFPVDCRSLGWQTSDSCSTSGGSPTATFYYSNHLNLTYQSGMYEAFICAERPGDSSFKLIGTTKPSSGTNGGFRDLQFDDYGSPYNDNQTYPIWMTNANCNGGSAQNDTLVTTIVSGAGTTNLTVANAATNSVTAQTAIFDNGPNVVTAANTIKSTFPTGAFGTLYFPPTPDPAGGASTYIINSYTVLPAAISIKQAGVLKLNDTLQLSGATGWDGSWSYTSNAQFSQSSGASVSIGAANPGIYAIGVNNLRWLNVTLGNQNGGVVEVVDSNASVGDEWDHFNCSVNSNTNNYLGMCLVLRGLDGSSETKFNFKDSLFNDTNPASTPLPIPIIYAAPGQNGSGVTQISGAHFSFSNTNFSMSGLEWESCGGGPTIVFSGNRNVRQGGYMPLVTAGNCTGNASAVIDLSGITEDTDTQGLLNIENPGGAFSSYITLGDSYENGVEAGGNGANLPITGWIQLSTTNSSTVVSHPGNLAGRLPSVTGFGSCPGFANGPFFTCDNEPLLIQPPNGLIFAPIAAPTSLTASATSGGAIAAGTYQFSVAAVDVAGNQGSMSALSSAITTSGGTQTATLSWTAPVLSSGPLTYNISVCGGAISTCPTMRQTTTGITGTSTALTSLTAGGAFTPSAADGGLMGWSPINGILWTPQLFINQESFGETTAPAAATNQDVCYGDSTAHALKCSFNNESFIQMAQVVAVPLTVGSGTGNVFVAPNGYFVCTTTCTVTPPLPTAGVQFCALNDDNVSTVITLGALGGSGHYENTARTAYGTAGTGTAVSGGAAGDKLCLIGRDTTHYLVVSSVGTWTMN